MIKSELIRRISSQNPHLYDRDLEKVVNAILDEMIEALRRGSNCGGSEPFQLSSEKHARGAIHALVLSSRSQRKLILSSRRERRYARGLMRTPISGTKIPS